MAVRITHSCSMTLAAVCQPAAHDWLYGQTYHLNLLCVTAFT